MQDNAALIAWAAGLFEGEGCFTSCGKPGVYGRQSYQAILAMTDEDVVNRFAAVVRVGAVWPTKQKRGNGKPVIYWRCGARRELEVLVAAFWPWLGTRRRARIRELQKTAELRAGTPADAWRTRRRNVRRTSSGQFTGG